MSPERVLVTAIFFLATAAPGLAQQVDERNGEKIAVPEVPDTSGKRPDLEAAARRIVDQTNAFRKGEKLGPTAIDPQLTAAARSFAGFMARNDLYGHTADGKRPAERARKHGYDFCIVLENIANAFNSRGFETAELADKFVTGWQESPGHRRNMLDPDVTHTGVALARSEKTGYYYAVQMFGRPASAAIEFRVENRSGEAVQYSIGEQSFDLPQRTIRTHTRCRPAKITFDWPGGATASVEPADGDRLVVDREGSAFTVRKQ